MVAEERIMIDTMVKPTVIWLTWKDKLGKPDAIEFSSVSRAEAARASEKAEVESLLRDYKTDLDRSAPGYVWRIEVQGSRPTVTYAIRGDLSW